MSDPHADQPLERAGAALDGASAAAVMIHGRGATARGILSLADDLDHPGVAFLAPQAAGNEWYPNRFIAPVEANEPGLTSALDAVERAVDTATDAGIPAARVLVLGFSQGACLAAEYVARNPRRYGGAAVLSGGLIGEAVDADEYDGDLADTPVFLGCDGADPHIPVERVHLTAEILSGLGAAVTTRIYDGMGHRVSEDELSVLAGMLAALDGDG